MKRFNALTKVTAKPMTRQEYNDLRGWELPADEDGSDDGYLTVDVNADSNFDGYDGHVSWKPKALFDDQFYEVDDEPVGVKCTAPSDLEPTLDEVATLASNRSLCNCLETGDTNNNKKESLLERHCNATGIDSGSIKCAIGTFNGEERFGFVAAVIVAENCEMSVQCDDGAVATILTPEHAKSKNWRIVDTPKPSHLTRLNIEIGQLQDRIDKLQKFLSGVIPDFIAESEIKLLADQHRHMLRYRDILNRRINKT